MIQFKYINNSVSENNFLMYNYWFELFNTKNIHDFNILLRLQINY